MYKGLRIKSLSGSIKSMFALGFFVLFFWFCFFPAAPQLQLPFASERISEDDDDDEWQGLLHLAPISELPSFPLSICYRKKGWHMPIIFLSLPLHSTPPHPHPLVCRHACLLSPMSQPGTITLALWFWFFFSLFFDWVPSHGSQKQPSPNGRNNNLTNY